MASLLAVLALTGAGVASAGTREYNLYLTRTNPRVRTYRHQVHFSGNGTVITSYTVNDWSTYTAIGWAFTDIADEAVFTYTANGVQYKRKTTNGHYNFGIWPLVDDDYAWIESTVGAGGQHWMNGSGY